MAERHNTNYAVQDSVIGAMFIGGKIKNTHVNTMVSGNPAARATDDTDQLQPGQIKNSVVGAVFAGVEMDKVTVNSCVNSEPWDKMRPNDQGLYSYKSCIDPEKDSPTIVEEGEIYKMDSHPYKGAAFILNNNYFPGYPEEMNERKGSELDIKNAKGLWKHLGFYVKTAENKSAEEIMDEISDFLSLPRVTETDCVVVMLMSHGGRDVIQGNDRQNLKYSDIFDLFQPDNCPELKKKPKLFFIQACRGRKMEVGVDANPVPEQHTGASSNPIADALRTPLPADFFVAHSTCSGFYSLRSHVSGSYFVQALCEVFYPLAHQQDLNSMMTEVSRKVSEGRKSVPIKGKEEVIMQQPQIHSTLNKKVYFKAIK